MTRSFIREDRLESVRDATQLAFYGDDFTVLADEEKPIIGSYTVLSAAMRHRSAYDSSAGAMVDVVEMHALLDRQGKLYPEHRVRAEWDNGERYEVELDEGEVVQYGDDAEPVRVKIIQTLAAATSIV